MSGVTATLDTAPQTIESADFTPRRSVFARSSDYSRNRRVDRRSALAILLLTGFVVPRADRRSATPDPRQTAPRRALVSAFTDDLLPSPESGASSQPSQSPSLPRSPSPLRVRGGGSSDAVAQLHITQQTRETALQVLLIQTQTRWKWAMQQNRPLTNTTGAITAAHRNRADGYEKQSNQR